MVPTQPVTIARNAPPTTRSIAAAAVIATTKPAAPIVQTPIAPKQIVQTPIASKPIAQNTIAQSQQETPDNIRISPDQPPSGVPTLSTPPATSAPQPTLPPTEIQLPPSATPPNPGTPGATPPAADAGPRVLVAEVAVQGVTGTLEDEIYRAIRTRPGQTTTRTQLQEDINAIFATGYFANVQAAPEDTPLGVRVAFVVEPNPVLKAVQVQGNKVVTTADVDKIFQPQYGTTLNLRQLQQGIQTLTKQYQDQGYVLAQVVDVPKISPDGVVTLELAEGEVEGVQVKFINKEGSATDDQGRPLKGRTRDFIITREMETKPGNTFNRKIAERDLQRVFGLGIFEDIKLELNPGEDPRKVNVIVNVAERSSSNVSAGGGISSASGLFGTISYQQQNLGGNNQRLGSEIQLGQRELLFDINFTDPWIANDPYKTSYTINGFRRRNISLIFDGGDDVRILNDGIERDRPRVVRTGGGVSFTRPLSKDNFKRADWTASLGLRYEAVRLQDGDGDLIDPNAAQTNDAGTVVGFGRDLSFSGTSKDDLFTVQFGLVKDNRNSALTPTSGSLFRIGTEQSIPIGNGSLFFNRLRTSYSFYQPTRLLKLSPGCRDVDKRLVEAARPKVDPNGCPQVFAFNFQAGTVLGDLPPYEAFSLGGSNSVRGYEEGAVGSGKTFLQASAEYRFPVFSIISGALFIDAATDLGTGSEVRGNPAGLRNKPGGGIGYGLGVRVQSPLGPIRVDYGFNDQGESRFHFGLGERF
jgi:outer membrane protein insertion porin family